MNNSSPNISVIMPVYNGGVFLKEAIVSVLNQSYSDFELILLNDGSTDNSEEIIHSLSDERIRYIKNEKNSGLIATLNRGLSESRGKFIVRMDQDDISLPNRFQKQIDYLSQHPQVAVVSSKLMLIDENGNDKGCWNDDYETTSPSEIEMRMPKLNCIGHPTVMMRVEIIKHFGYNSYYKNSEDWGLWLTLLSNGYVIAKIDEVLVKYRIHEKSTTVGENKINVSKKIIRFKRSYILNKLVTFNFKGIDKKVFRYWIIDMMKYYVPSVYSGIIKFIQTNYKELRIQKREFNIVFDKFPNEIGSLFFFPFYHLGGAENVHLDIVNAVKLTKPLILFTDYSGSDTLLKDFKSVASTLNIDQLLIWPGTRAKVIEKISMVCEQNKRMILFSSNSWFYYEFLKSKPSNTKAIDLIHAFMHEHEFAISSEGWSLPVLDKLDYRVIINKKTGKDLENLYKNKNVSQELLKRIIYIPNFVELNDKPSKDNSGSLKIVYVGRGTSEKRVHLLAMIAKRLKENGSPIEFHFVGDVLNAIPHDLQQFCVIHGEVKDKSVLHQLYSKAHILAMASTREGFPLVIMEAMMHAVIPITTNVGGISDHVNDSNGILINEIESSHFSDTFVAEIEKLISDRTRMQKLSDGAYEYAVKNFSKEQFVTSYKELFNG